MKEERFWWFTLEDPRGLPTQGATLPRSARIDNPYLQLEERFKVSPFHVATILARVAFEGLPCPVHLGAELTDQLGWPRPLPHSIRGQCPARRVCEAIRHEFRRAS